MEIEQLTFLPIYSRFATNKGITVEDAKEIHRETLRFLSLISKGEQNYACLSPIVDEYWHELILHTQIYLDYCKDSYGCMVHHLPEVYSTSNELHLAQQSYARLLDAYISEFSEPPPAYIWPRAFDSNISIGCKGCNGCAGPIRDI